jgi:hypothetical protein
MDISKIISDSIDEAVKDTLDGKFSAYPEIDDKAVANLSDQNAMLMNYSNVLLSTYHEELRKVLAEQGITI